MAEQSEVDLAAVNGNVMLIKVPKYVSKLWDGVGPGGSVGKLRASSKLNKREFTFVLKQDLVNQSAGDLKIPAEYKLHSQGAANRIATAFSETVEQEEAYNSSGDGSSNQQAGKLALEGQVAERAELRPVGGDSYMKMKRLQIKAALQPVRTTKPIDKRVTIKPRTNHNVNKFIDKKRAEVSKKARLEEHQVMDMLFKAFEKHQYYSFKDLVQITQQPSPYLKEILKNIGTYNTKAPHKFMWELKAEYRHYHSNDAAPS